MPHGHIENKFKQTANKGYYGMMKGVVTRNIKHLRKPELYLGMFADETEYNEVYKNIYKGMNDNKWEIQVWIPAYHGGKEPDPLKIGTAADLGEYPWAQMCGPIFKDDIGKGEPCPNIWSNLFNGTYLEDVPSTYPAIGDIVWLMFENGDIGKPVFVGSLLCDNNKCNYGNINNLAENEQSTFDVLTYNINQALDAITLDGAVIGYPLDHPVPMSSPFGWRGPVGQNTDRHLHKGIDLSEHGIKGAFVYATHGGVAYAGKDNSMGNYVRISGVIKRQTTERDLEAEAAFIGPLLPGDTGYIYKYEEINVNTYYMHFNNFVNIAEGESKLVEQGDIIGQVGTTGNSTGPHLHFGLELVGQSFTYTDAVSGRSKTCSFIDPTGILGMAQAGNTVVKAGAGAPKTVAKEASTHGGGHYTM